MRKRIVAAVAVAAAALAAPAIAATPVTGGKTVLKPDPATFEGLADMSISVGTTGGSSDNANGVKFPITGGEIEEGGPTGFIFHKGGLVFSHNVEGGETVKLKKYSLKLGPNKAKLFATKSGQDALRFLDIDLSDAEFGGLEGVSLTIKNAEATLAKPAAELLSESFDFPFRKGIPIGTINTKAELPG